jgi:hypothetical protein
MKKRLYPSGKAEKVFSRKGKGGGGNRKRGGEGNEKRGREKRKR